MFFNRGSLILLRALNKRRSKRSECCLDAVSQSQSQSRPVPLFSKHPQTSEVLTQPTVLRARRCSLSSALRCFTCKRGRRARVWTTVLALHPAHEEWGRGKLGCCGTFPETDLWRRSGDPGGRAGWPGEAPGEREPAPAASGRSCTRPNGERGVCALCSRRPTCRLRPAGQGRAQLRRPPRAHPGVPDRGCPPPARPRRAGEAAARPARPQAEPASPAPPQGSPRPRPEEEPAAAPRRGARQVSTPAHPSRKQARPFPSASLCGAGSRVGGARGKRRGESESPGRRLRGGRDPGT